MIPFFQRWRGPKPWDTWRARYGLRIPGRPTFAHARSGSFGGTLSFGCSPGVNPLETHYARMAAGDTNALEAARRLSEKEKAGTATASEMAALWGLRALAENGQSPANAQSNASTAMQLLQQASSR